MNKFISTLIFLLCAVTVYAQCVATVTDVKVDTERGSIIVETQYNLNNQIVGVDALPCDNCVGMARYTEETGTLQEIVAKAKEDINTHCENLIVRNAIIVNDLLGTKLAIAIDAVTPLIDTLKENAIGWTKQVDEKVIIYKDKEITIDADGTYTVNPVSE